MSQAYPSTTEAAQVQPNAPIDGHLHLTAQTNDAIVSQPNQSTNQPPEYSENNPSEKAVYTGNEITSQPEPVSHTTNPEPPKIQPGLENRSPVTLGELGETPNCVQCPLCSWRVITRVEKHSGDHASKMAVVACLCLGICCAWLPFVIDDCKDSEHFCPNCGYQLAVWEKGSGTAKIIMTEGKIKSIQTKPQNSNPNAPQAQNPTVSQKEQPVTGQPQTATVPTQ